MLSAPSYNQRLPEQLMDEQADLKVTCASMAKRVFVRNYWYENVLLKHSFCKRQLRRWKLNLHMCQAVHQASTHSSFCSMKRLEVFFLTRFYPLKTAVICVFNKEITVIYLHILQYVVPLLLIAPSWGTSPYS